MRDTTYPLRLVLFRSKRLSSSDPEPPPSRSGLLVRAELSYGRPRCYQRTHGFSTTSSISAMMGGVDAVRQKRGIDGGEGRDERADVDTFSSSLLS